MKAYNGFTPTQRARALVWGKKRGNPPPAQCMACGQMDGPIDAHSEDYSEPFGSHIGAFAFCYVCHMMLHCREGSPQAWARYLTMLEAGRRHVLICVRDFEVVKAILRGGGHFGFYSGPVPHRGILRLIDEQHITMPPGLERQVAPGVQAGLFNN